MRIARVLQAHLLVALALGLVACPAPPPAPAPPRLRDAPIHKRAGTYWHFVENVTYEKSRAADPFFRLWVALPPDRPGQRVRVGAIEPPPTEVLEDPFTGNRVAYWQVRRPAEGSSLRFRYDFEVENHALLYDVDPARVERVPASAPEHARFTRSEPWVEITPEIRAKAREIVGAETNPYLQARLVFDWVVEHVTYEYPDVKQRGARLSFARLKGDCGEFSHIFMAMMRSLGVPARSVTAVWYQGSGHAWAEVLLPPYGWVPVDTSVAQLVQNGLKGQQTDEAVREFMRTRGIPVRDGRWLFGHLYPHRLEVFVGDHVTFRARAEGGTRTFNFLQPGGLAGWPPAVELGGLGKQTVHAGFYLFDGEARDEKVATGRALEELAPMYSAAGLHERALPGLELAVRKKPDRAQPLFQLGQTYFSLKRYRQAIETLARALGAKGGSTKPVLDVWAHILSGMSHDALGEREAAKACYERAIATGVDHANAQKTARIFLAQPFSPEPAGSGPSSK